MATPILYTTTNAIRAAIGVTEKEVPNEAFVDLTIEDQLVIYLNRVFPGYVALASAIQGGSPTDDQKAQWRSLKLVCTYESAYLMLQGGQYLLSQQIESGGVKTTRFAKDDLETTIARMAAMRDEYLGILLDDDTLNGVDFVSPMIGVSPGYDPVKGC